MTRWSVAVKCNAEKQTLGFLIHFNGCWMLSIFVIAKNWQQKCNDVAVALSYELLSSPRVAQHSMGAKEKDNVNEGDDDAFKKNIMSITSVKVSIDSCTRTPRGIYSIFIFWTKLIDFVKMDKGNFVIPLIKLRIFFL